MNSIDYGFVDYLDTLWNLYQVRGGFTSANAARHIMDIREEIYVAWLEDQPAQEFYLEDAVWDDEE